MSGSLSSPTRTPVTSVGGAPNGTGWARLLGRAVLLWFLVSLIILLLVGAWGPATYLVLFGLLFGEGAWIARGKVRAALRAFGLDNLAGFVLLAVGVSTLEEVVAYLCGGPGALAIHNLAIDLVWIDAIWLGWQVPWFLVIPRWFAFSEAEALVVGGSVGVLFEVIVSRVFLAGILALVWVPLGWVVYAVVLLLPLQLVRFPARSTRPWRVPTTIAITWGAGLATALLLYVIFRAMGLPT